MILVLFLLNVSPIWLASRLTRIQDLFVNPIFRGINNFSGRNTYLFHQSVAKKSPIWLTIRSYRLCQLLLPSSNVWVSWTRLKTQLLRSDVVSSKASSSCLEQISCLTKLDLWTSLIPKMLKLLDLDFSLVDEQATNKLERSNAYISQVWDSKPAFGKSSQQDFEILEVEMVNLSRNHQMSPGLTVLRVKITYHCTWGNK